jgi:hypothetical protein
VRFHDMEQPDPSTHHAHLTVGAPMHACWKQPDQ